MRITFIDPVDFPYTPETPLEKPLGGIRSAVSYLTVALAARGHQVLLLNRSAAPSTYRGVQTKPLPVRPTADLLDNPDAVVVVNAPNGADLLRNAGVTTCKILWCHHAPDDEEMEPLHQANFRKSWDAFAMVSGWQRGQYAENFHLPEDRMAVLGNAVAPIFETAQPDYRWLNDDGGVKIAYTSTPYRGLHLLLSLTPSLRTRMPALTVSIFSGQSGYALTEEKDPYRIYYDLARALSGVDYRGSIPQADLAAALPGHAALAYPCIFQETACIAAMEAMACGLLPIITDIGALSETVGKFGFVLPNMERRRTAIELLHDYLGYLMAVISEAKRRPEATKERLKQQVSFVRTNYTWAKRAQEWETVLQRLLSQQR
jgi:glycosyltransferase involved in cell wall biosynthesis